MQQLKPISGTTFHSRFYCFLKKANWVEKSIEGAKKSRVWGRLIKQGGVVQLNLRILAQRTLLSVEMLEGITPRGQRSQG